MVLFTTRLTGWVFVRDFAAIGVAYVAGVTFLPRPLFLEILNAMLMTLSVTVAVVYSLDTPQHFRALNYKVAIMRVGIAGAWWVTAYQAMSRTYFIEFRPEVRGQFFDALAGVGALGYILFASFHLIAIGMDGNEYVRKNLYLVMWSLVAGAVLIGAVRGVQYLL